MACLHLPDLSDHPLVADRLTRLRARDCPPADFRRYLTDIGRLLVLPATAHLASQDTSVETPLQEMTGKRLGRPVILVPILRAGLALCDPFQLLIPEAIVAHLGMARDEETLEPVTYYANIPEEIESADVLVLDPMLATAGSACAAVTELKSYGAQHLHFVCLVAAPEGITRLQAEHPEVTITCAAIDDGLNEKGYIVPGLGDAGDRTFGTV